MGAKCLNKRKKIIIASKYFLFYDNGKIRESAIDMLEQLKTWDISLRIIARRVRHNELNNLIRYKIPSEYCGMIQCIERGKDGRASIDAERMESSISMIAVVDEDAEFAFQTKIPIINPIHFLKDAPVSDKVKRYGIDFTGIEDVILAVKLLDSHYNNFCEYKENEQFEIVSVLDGNTNCKPDALRDLFQVNIKDRYGKSQRILNLIFYYILSETSHNPIFKEVNYWGNFPSSSGAPNQSMVFLKEMLRITHGGSRGDDQILIRQKPTDKKHYTERNTRLKNKCSKDFDTIIINQRFKSKLKNKVVCIVDDYTTNGYSSEAAKHLLLKAGVKKVIFLAVGKYGKYYCSTQYDLEGNVFKENSVVSHFISEKKITNCTKGMALELSRLEELFEVHK